MTDAQYAEMAAKADRYVAQARHDERKLIYDMIEEKTYKASPAVKKALWELAGRIMRAPLNR